MLIVFSKSPLFFSNVGGGSLGGSNVKCLLIIAMIEKSGRKHKRVWARLDAGSWLRN